MNHRHLFLSISLTLLLGLLIQGQSEIISDPIGVAVFLDQEDNDSLTIELSISNLGEETVEFAIDVNEVEIEEEDRLSPSVRRVPRRDDAGDEIASFEGINRNNTYCSPTGWDWDNERMWITSYNSSTAVAYTHDNYEDFEIVIQINPGRCMFGAWVDGIYYTSAFGTSVLLRFDTDGNELQSIEIGTRIYGIAADNEEGLLFIQESGNNNAIKVFELEDGGIGERIGVISNHLEYHDNARAYNLEWVPEHYENGQLWMNGDNTLYQILVDTEEWECVDSDDAVEFDVELTTVYDAVAHDGFNMWAAGMQAQDIRIYDDGNDEQYIDWIIASPDDGLIEPDSSVIVELNFASTNYESGIRESFLEIEITEPDGEREDEPLAILEMSVILTIDDDVATVTGNITSARTGEPVRGVSVDLDLYSYIRFTDEEGDYSMNDLPLGEYVLTITADNYLPTTEAFEIEEAGEIELDIELLQADCAIDRDSVVIQVDVDDIEEIEITLTNNMDGQLTYEVVKRLPEEARAEIGDLLYSYNISEIVDDDHIEGAVYFNEHFFVSGRGGDPNQIYIVDKDGEYLYSFDQPGHSNSGLLDLAWDGEWLWGGDNARDVYAFTPDGDVELRLPGPALSNQATAWDSDRELIWVTGIISDEIYAYNRQSERIMIINQQNLRIYGLAYWSEDPDGYQLYVLGAPDQETSVLYKIDIENSDVMRVAILEHEEGGRPKGCFITQEYDIYSLVLMSVTNNDDNDRIDIWHLNSHTDWMMIEPTEGVVQAEQSEVFTLTLDATGLPQALFEGQIVWLHDGVGGETILDIAFQVGVPPQPPSAFSLLEPVDGDTLRPVQLTFAWEESIDPNPEDVVNYRVWLKVNGDSISIDLQNTTFNLWPDTLGMNLPWSTSIEWWVEVISGFDVLECNARFSFSLDGQSVDEDDISPFEFALYGAFPNPFNSMTRIEFSLIEPSSVILRILDLNGREVTEIIDSELSLGRHELVWDASGLATGQYFIQLITPTARQVQKAVLVR